MKKLIAIAVVAGFLVPAIAGAEANGITGKGIKLGLNYTNATGSDVKDAKAVLGIAAGGFLTYSINDMWAIQPELLYSQKGYKYEFDFLGTTVASSIATTYLDIPILVRLNIPTEGTMKPNIVLGPSVGILMSAKAKASVAGITVATTDVKKDSASTDIGMVVGAGIESGTMSYDLRYQMGLSALDKDGKAKAYNSVISLLIGWSFK